MSEAIMTIRQMCEMFGVTARTLRFYEDRELLSPIREGQKRLYTKRERARLKLILRGKRFGFSLEEIRQLLDLYDKDDTQYLQLSTAYEVAQQRLTVLRAERDALNEAIIDLEKQMRWGRKMLSQLQNMQPVNDNKKCA